MHTENQSQEKEEEIHGNNSKLAKHPGQKDVEVTWLLLSEEKEHHHSLGEGISLAQLL